MCVCTRHRPDELRTCLQSIEQSTVPVAQVVVSDDSQPGDRRSEALVAAEFPHVRYVEGPRVGLGANRNRAIQEATTDYVLFLDDDAELAPTFIEEMASFSRERGLGLTDVVSGLERKSGTLVIPQDQGFLGFQDQPYGPGDPMNTVVINATLFPRNLFSRVTFDEQLVYGCDEVDLTTRARHAGYRVSLNRDAVNPHHHTDAGREYYRPYIDASRLYVTFKRYWQTDRAWGKAALFAVVGPAHLLASNFRRDGPQGVGAWLRSVRTAATYLARHRKS